MKAFIHAKLMLEDRDIEDGYLVFDQRILDVGDMTHFPVDKGIDTIDLKGNILCPGFIDIHIHGCGGADTMDGSQDALETISRHVRKSGVTAFLATTMTMPLRDIYNALDAIRAFERPNDGARIIGAHLEGPFIHKAKKGAQNASFIHTPDFNLIKNHLDIIKIITLAPDTEGAFDFINEMKAFPHVRLSIGHTDADFETAENAFKQGVTHVTHCFNAMPPLHHRKPGVIGAIMGGEFTTELIADNVHVHRGLYKGLLRSVGDSHLVLVTDSMQAGGLPNGQYQLGGQWVKVEHDTCTLQDGTLAGSVLTMNQAIKNVVEATGIPLYKAVAFASINPAKVIGLDKDYGSIAIGKLADFTLMTPDYEIINTYIEGEGHFFESNHS